MRSTTHTNPISGFTLMELMIAIAVLAIMATLAVPALTDLIRNNRVTSQSNELVALINFARSESIRRNDSITVELTSNTDGWSGEVKDPTGEGADPCTASGALRCSRYDQVLLTSGLLADGVATFDFNNRGYVDGFSQVDLVLTHTDCSGKRQRSEITILPTGQVSSTVTACPE